MGVIAKLKNTYRDRVLDKVLKHQYDPSISRRPENDEMPLGLMFQQYADSPEVPKRIMRMAQFFGLNKQQLAHPNHRGKQIIERCNSCRMRGICFTNRHGKMIDTVGFDRERCANIETYRSLAQQSGKRTTFGQGLVRQHSDLACIVDKPSRA